VVTDWTGAVVPNTAVTVVHWDTSEVGHATINEDSVLKSNVVQKACFRDGKS
jgi:hypothetical protein